MKKFRLNISLLAIALLILLTGCGTAQPVGMKVEAAQPSTGGAENVEVKAPNSAVLGETGESKKENRGIAAGSLESSLTFENGGKKFVFEVKNQSEQEQVLSYGSGQEFDYIILDEQGKHIYTWSADKSFITMLQTKVLKQGESMRFEEDLGSILGPGKYTIEIWLTAKEVDVKETAVFEIQ